MDAMLAVVRPAAGRGLPAEPSDGARAAELRTTIADGEQIRRWFVDRVHGDARPGVTPDVVTLTRRMTEFAAAVRDLLTAVPA